VTDLDTHELASIFATPSKHTDVQRENKINEINTKVVVWNVIVYEVKRPRKFSYEIQTSWSEKMSATFLYINAQNEEDINKIERLITGDNIRIKGRIEGVFLRFIIIRDVIILN